MKVRSVKDTVSFCAYETGDRFAKFMGMELKRTQKRIQNNFRQKEKAQNADLTTF